MCGIVGFNFQDKELLKKMMASIEHRGPDQKGGIIYNNFSVGHQRLSIIDLNERSKQPMCNEEGDIWITFNGEIYNYKELRKELELKGHKFKTESDTEVIIHAYEEYGADCLNLFNGMFAFAILDNKKLFLARDPIGIKPLYYYHFDGKFIFASEVKAILKSKIVTGLDHDSLNNLLNYRTVPRDKTLFINIKKLLPGHYLIYEEDRVFVKQYYNLEISQDNIAEDILANKLRKLFEQSIKRRLIADVPIGAFLSGGLDSSCVVGMMSKLGGDVKTFTAGFNEENDEMPYAKKVAEKFNTDHTEVYINYKDMTKEFDKIVYHMDEPIADPAAFPVYFVSKMARAKVKVALFGEGADELFGGYSKYKILRNWILPVQRYIRIDRPFINEQENFYGQRNDSVIKSYFKNSNHLNNALYFDLKEILPNFQLMKVDKMTMMNGIEGRVPFLDKEIVDFAFKIPENLKINPNYGKYILRKAMKDILPKEILFGEKRIFFTPLKKWFDNGLREIARERLLESSIFNNKGILKLINNERHSFRRYKYSNQLWSLLMIQTWFNKYMDENG